MVTARAPFTEAEYLALERASDRKHELIDGAILAMAGADLVHNLVCSNAIVALRRLADRNGCLVLTSDQRVHIPTTGAYVYPDVTVVCGRPQRHPADTMSITNPSVLLEVVSPGSLLHDRAVKVMQYREIASLEHDVVIRPDVRFVEHHRRIGDRKWELVELRRPVDELDILDGRIVLSELFAQLDRVAAES